MAIPARRAAASSPQAESIFVSATDGLMLHVRAFGPRCAEPRRWSRRAFPQWRRFRYAGVWAGGTRRRRSAGAGARLSRRRGRSQYDRNPANYNVMVELDDMIGRAHGAGGRPAVLIGDVAGRHPRPCCWRPRRPAVHRGRGAQRHRPGDRAKGLTRIKSYVGKMPRPGACEEGATSSAVIRPASSPTDRSDVARHRIERVRRRAGMEGWFRATTRRLALTLDRHRSRTAPAPALGRI